MQGASSHTTRARTVALRRAAVAAPPRVSTPGQDGRCGMAWREVEGVRSAAEPVVVGRLGAVVVWTWAAVYAAAAVAGRAGTGDRLLLAGIAAVAATGALGFAGTSGRIAWPLVVWAPAYKASVDVVSRFPTRYVDPALAGFDTWLLGLVGLKPLWPLDGPVEEVLNGFYVSYYLLVPLGLLWTWRRSEEAAARYGLALVASFAGCAAIWLAFPSGGWHLAGAPGNAGLGPMTAIAHGVYALHPHHAAAFPSSHVALAVSSVAVARSCGGRAWLWIWPLGIAAATVYGQYHYVPDAFGGWAVGLLGAHVALRASRGTASVPVRA